MKIAVFVKIQGRAGEGARAGPGPLDPLDQPLGTARGVHEGAGPPSFLGIAGSPHAAPAAPRAWARGPKGPGPAICPPGATYFCKTMFQHICTLMTFWGVISEQS